uniref:Doublesex- and mab-3-related transcription factor C1/C2 C-terminal domain-containing protein n=1 Tax=Moschus moschiferus TaxID=68415 RepID=A0A8C6CT64_MOSMO
MDPNEMPAMPCCLPNSTTELETGAPKGIELGPRRSVRLCARCHNHGITDQIKDQEHLCLFQAYECHKEHYSVSPAERDLKVEQEPYPKRRPTRGRKRGGTTSSRGHGRAKKLGPQARVPNNLPRRPAARSGLGIFVSVLDSSTLEEATNNFSFEEVTQIPCPAQQAPEASNQASVSASSEWQRKLEAAEAPPGSISLLQPCVAPAPDGDKGLQPSSPSLWPRPASSISLPIGHLGCISLLN